LPIIERNPNAPKFVLKGGNRDEGVQKVKRKQKSHKGKKKIEN